MATIECVCPPKADGSPRHPNGDTVTLRERLSYVAAMTVRNDLGVLKNEDPDSSVGETLAVLSQSFALVGVESWTLTDEKGKPLPVTRANIRAFLDDNIDAGLVVANEAHERYYDKVIGPLVRTASTSSLPTPISGSTSARNGSVPAPRKRSKPSSTTTTPTDGTMPMSASPGGVFS